MIQSHLRGLSRLTAAIAICAGLVSPGGIANAKPLPQAPSIQGMWWPDGVGEDVKPLNGPIAYTPAGMAASAANAASLKAEAGKPKERDDLKSCLPAGPVRILQQPYPLQIVQKGKMVVLIYEHNHVFEVVYLDDAPGEAEKADPSYMGYSSGAWSKGALLVSTANFNDQTMLSDLGIPHSDQLKVTRKIQAIDSGKHLEVISTITDPVMFKKAWSVRQVLTLRPDTHIEEFVCGQGPMETRYTRQALSK